MSALTQRSVVQDHPPVRSANRILLVPPEGAELDLRAVDSAKLVQNQLDPGSPSQSGTEDAQLVGAFLRGDREAYRVLWNRHAKVVRQVLRRALGGDSIEDDLVQEAFLILAQRASQILEPRALRPYLVSVALRLALSERRRRRARNALLLTPTGKLPDTPLPPPDFDAIEAARALSLIVEQLSARRRLAFTLRCVQKLTVPQIAGVLGVSRATAKREIDRARALVVRQALSHPALRDYSERALRRPRRGRTTPKPRTNQLGSP